MAKNNKKGAGAQDTDEMSKSELKAYHQEICEYFLKNGWRETLSNYLLSPAQAGPITEKVRAKRDKDDAAAKAAKKKAKKEKKAKKAAKKTSPKKPPKNKPDAKEDETEKPAGKKSKGEKKPKAKISKKKPGRKPGRRAKKSSGTVTVDPSPTTSNALEALLDYRSRCGPGVSLDTAIVEISIATRSST